ncbi:hypothetical protein ABPG75_011989 [Micractinium tetrahymenae]
MLSKAAACALLALLLVQGAAAQSPPPAGGPITAVPAGGFTEKGGPPAGVGIFRGTSDGAPLIALNTPIAYTFVWYDPSGQVFTEIANYTSWQCAPYMGPGGYIATYTGRDYAYDFSYENITYCELGVIDLKAGTWDLVDKPVSEGCPVNMTDGDVYNTTLVPPTPADVKGYASPSTAFCGA